MAFFSRHVRLLYLLALFQLVGGPLVLCGVMMFVRLGADKDVTLTQQVARAIESAQSLEQRTAGDENWAQADGVPTPVKAPAPVPAKTKEGKIKMLGISEFFEGVVLRPCAVALPLESWHDPTPAKRAHALPLPPPRVV